MVQASDGLQTEYLDSALTNGSDGSVPVSVDPAGTGSNGHLQSTHGYSMLFLSAALLVAANLLLLSGHRLVFIGAALGWWLIMIHPTYLICTTRIGKTVSGVERVAYCLGAVLLALLVGGLLLNELLPHLGVPRPLAQRPILLAVDVMNVGLMGWRNQRGAIGVAWRANLRLLRRREWRVLAASGCCLPLVVAGANRLNNGAGDLVALLGLSFVAVTFALLLWWRKYLRESVIAASIYVLGLSLLLATSLRGWYITGHDIQREYRVFELTKDHGVWNIGSFRNAYTACLSITILPTEIWQLIRVDDPYVYKVFFQLLFATCPVLVYLLARRYWSKQIAILGVIYFVGFPTFFTDMPFLNRQEIAFLFLGLAFLAMSRRQWTVWRRRTVMLVCALGIGLSHYSTMYVFICTLAIALIAEYVYLGSVRLRTSRRTWKERRTIWSDTARTVTLGLLLVVGLVTFLWGGPITRTATGVEATIKEALPSVGGVHSVDASYSLLSGGGPSSQEILKTYKKSTLHDRKIDDAGSYLPLAKMLAFKTPTISTPSLPPTSTGNLLSHAHVSAALLNDAVRDLASRGEQVFIGVGLIAVGLVRRRRREVGRDFYFLALAGVVMVAAVTVLPGLSVSYGLLRALQQALILVAPILVIGSIVVFKPLGPTWSVRMATIVAFVFFISTIGVMPQILGGYPAQLNLNNSGSYYDDYYAHPQDIEALDWLGGQPDTLPIGVQAEPFTDLYYFKNPNDISGGQFITDIYPTLIRKSTWVVLGYSTVHNDTATTSIDGDLIEYRYPMGALSQNKNLVYNNGGTEIYK